MRKTTIHCDVCKGDEALEKRIQIIFETEQTEGRNCSPYLCIQDIDICRKCMALVLEGNYIFASGAQGNNDYYFRKE